MSSPADRRLKWYEGISRYQWLVLTIASLGWVFDVFEGQVFVASMRDAMPALLQVPADDKLVTQWNDLSFASFLLGGAVGGIGFGVLGDKWGRSRTMIVTILFYSLFTCATAFTQAAWQMVVLRFLVAMGVGGEWAVASAMVAEVMPQRSRSVMSSIFHASSVFGTLLAAATGAFVVANPALGANAWRWGFALGALPALLTLWVRWRLREPETWVKARQSAGAGPHERVGSLTELVSPAHVRNTLVGVSLASIGLVTFWGIHIYGKDALLREAQRQALLREDVPAAAPANDPAAARSHHQRRQAALQRHASTIKRAEMSSMVLNTIGGGLGLVFFGAIANRLGRKGAFALYHAVGFLMVLVLFQVLIPRQAPALVLAAVLPVFGFFTLGLHAGYAVYFPELYPTRLRGTGAGFCFNSGRLATAAAFLAFWLYPASPDRKALLLAPLYLVGLVIVWFARETRDDVLPE